MLEVIIFSTLSLAGLYGVYYFLRKSILFTLAFIKMRQSRHWTLTSGEIIDAEYRFLKSWEYIGQYQYRRKIELFLIQTYSYEVNGTSYTSKQENASDSLFFKDFKPLDQLPKDKTVALFIQNPNTTQLELFSDKISLKLYNRETLQLEAKSNIGHKVKLYFDPNRPEKACRSIKTDLFMLVSSFILFLFGVLSVYLSYFIIHDFLIEITMNLIT